MIEVRRGRLIETFLSIHVLAVVYFGAGLLLLSIAHTYNGDASLLVSAWLEATIEAGFPAELSTVLELPISSTSELLVPLAASYATAIGTEYGVFRSRGGRLTDLVNSSGGGRP